MKPFKVTVTAVKRSAVKKNIYYLTVVNSQGELKTIGKRNYKVGEEVWIKQRTPIDAIWDIVPTKQAELFQFREAMRQDFIDHGRTAEEADEVFNLSQQIIKDKENK